jgi:hypothetical protein
VIAENLRGWTYCDLWVSLDSNSAIFNQSVGSVHRYDGSAAHYDINPAGCADAERYDSRDEREDQKDYDYRFSQVLSPSHRVL